MILNAEIKLSDLGHSGQHKILVIDVPEGMEGAETKIQNAHGKGGKINIWLKAEDVEMTEGDEVSNDVNLATTALSNALDKSLESAEKREDDVAFGQLTDLEEHLIYIIKNQKVLYSSVVGEVKSKSIKRKRGHR